MELTQCINYLLTTAQHKVFQEMSSRLEKFDVTPVQILVSCIVYGSEGKTKPKENRSRIKARELYDLRSFRTYGEEGTDRTSGKQRRP
mgnify:CR=1 FL=1